MSDITAIVHARLPGQAGLYQIEIQSGKVNQVLPWQNDGSFAPTQLDLEGDWLTPGAVDLQINGALGLAFPDLRQSHLGKLREICDWLWTQGVSGFCPTLVTTSLSDFQGSLAALRSFRQQQGTIQTTAGVLGAHLEGPFLNSEKRGAHPAEHLQPLTLENVQRVIGDYADEIAIITLAPEQAIEPGVISWLVEQGITVSLGHSLATAVEAQRAFDEGATMVTHCFNAMPGLHHREPGLLGAALTDSRVSCGFIADGVHVSRTMLDLLLRTERGSQSSFQSSGGHGLFLVSDALAPLGLPDGTYPWDKRQITVTHGTARLPDGTLSGTTLPLIAGAKNLVAWKLCDVEEAITLVTHAPRRAIGLPGLETGLEIEQLWRWKGTQGLTVSSLAS